jgi:hypothetical protein
MSRSQLIALACALLGLTIGILIANWQFTEVGVLRGARALYGVIGFIIGYVGGSWYFVGRRVGRG